MRICQSQGIPHPDHLHQILSERQIRDWIIFHDLEPWGTAIDDYRAGLMTWGAILGKTGRKTYSPQFLAPKWGTPEPIDPIAYKNKARAVHARAARQLQ